MADSLQVPFFLPPANSEVTDSISGSMLVKDCLASVVSKHNVRPGEYVLYLLPNEEEGRAGAWLPPDKAFKDLHITKGSRFAVKHRFQLFNFHCDFAPVPSLKLIVDILGELGPQVNLWAHSFGVSMASELHLSATRDLHGALKSNRKPLEMNLNPSNTLYLLRRLIAEEGKEEAQPLDSPRVKPAQISIFYRVGKKKSLTASAAVKKPGKALLATPPGEDKFESRLAKYNNGVITIAREDTNAEVTSIKDCDYVEDIPELIEKGEGSKKKEEKKKVVSAPGSAKVEKSLLPLRFDLVTKKSEIFSFQLEASESEQLKWQKRIASQVTSAVPLSSELKGPLLSDEAGFYEMAHKDNAVFGVQIERTLKGEELVPRLVVECIEHIRGVAMELEGIFRLSGKQLLIESYRLQYNMGAKVNIRNEADPHTVAGVLKLFLREMPEPLMTFKHYNSYIEAMMQKDDGAKKRSLRRILHELPAVNFATLKYLMTFLHKVAQFSNVNKMMAANISTVFAPNLIKSAESDMMAMVAHSPQVNGVVVAMVESPQYFFAEELLARANFDYEAKQADKELSFKAGDILVVLEEGPPQGWWKGTLGEKTGMFPGSFVQLLMPTNENADDPVNVFMEKQALKKKLKKKNEEIAELTKVKESFSKRSPLVTESAKNAENVSKENAEIHAKISSILANAPLSGLPSVLGGEASKLVGQRQSSASLMKTFPGFVTELKALLDLLNNDSKLKKLRGTPFSATIEKMISLCSQDEEEIQHGEKVQRQVETALTQLKTALTAK